MVLLPIPRPPYHIESGPSQKRQTAFSALFWLSRTKPLLEGRRKIYACAGFLTYGSRRETLPSRHVCQ